MKFPSVRPQASNYIHPRDGETTTLTPPGFSWWRAAGREACTYRLIIDANGRTVYKSPPTPDPVHLPSVVFPPGKYTWHVEALAGDSVQATSEIRRFTIVAGSAEQPWVDPQKLLDRIPHTHPRVLFLKDQLDEIRSTLDSTRAEAFGVLKKMADDSMSLKPYPEPDYDRIVDKSERRLAYQQTFQETRRVHDRGTRALALMYLLTGDKKYGDHAKTLIVDAAQWDPEGISSIMAPYGDEVGLGLLRIGAEVYDWLYDIYADEERELVARMVAARADQMVRQLEQSDYTFKPEGSHNGRLPGFLLEHAIALAEDPKAADWAGYALKIIATNFPHWAGQDGGWAEGVPYGMSYNTRDATPFHAWTLATGHNIWLKPFYQGLPWFFYYAVSPIGEIMPFGDTEHQPVRPSESKTLMQYHALRLQDPHLRRWADQVAPRDNDAARVDPFPGIVYADDLITSEEADLPNDRVFRGIGWAALHSDVSRPTEDFMVAFRSSPYGGVSHGHASQNDIAIMKGGKALICAGGERFPHHGTPFHTEYARQSISHNCILVNGEGAVNRDGNRGGEIIDFLTQDRFGYVAGEAQNAYDELTRCRRHLLMIRPSVLILVDDLVASSPSQFQWLLHAFNRFEIDSSECSIVSERAGAKLLGHLFSSTSLSLRQTDEWPVAPDKGYPTLTKPLPKKRWHLTAETDSTDQCRIAALFAAAGPEESPAELNAVQEESMLHFRWAAGSDSFEGSVDLSTNSSDLIRIDLNGETPFVVNAN